MYIIKKKPIDYKLFFMILLHLTAFISLIFPYRIPLFSITLIIFFFISIIKNNAGVYKNYSIILVIITLITFLLAFIIDGGILYKNSLKDFINVVSMIILLISLGKYDIYQFNFVIDKTMKVNAIIVTVLSFFSLYKFFQYLNDTKIDFLFVQNRGYPLGTALMMDYNMFALGMLIGLMSLIFIIRNTESLFVQSVCFFAAFPIAISVIFSGSRRGWILLIPVLLYFVCSFIIASKYKIKSLLIIMFSLLIIISASSIINFKSAENLSNIKELERLEYRFSTLDNLKESYDTRTNRINYGFEIINKKSPFEYLFGGGFNYLKQYGNKFNSISGEDYPHNQLLSSFLYGGIFSLILTLITILIPIFLHFKNKRINIIYLNIYLLSFIFLFQSGNSFYTVNILWIILIHYLALPYNNTRIKGVKK